jgi:hypothetical protein
MATATAFPTKPETTEVTVLAIKVRDDITVLRLPDGVADIVVTSSELYVVHFKDRKAFGRSIVTLNKGHNIFAPLNGHGTDAFFFKEATVVKSLDNDAAMTPPIPVPPRR